MSHRHPARHGTRSPRAGLRRCAPGVAGAAGLAVIIGLAGCAGQTSKQTSKASSQSLAKARAKTVAAKTARVSVEAALSGSPGSHMRSFRATETGVVDFRNNAAEGTLTLPGSAPVQVRVVGGKLYERPAGHSTWTVTSTASPRSLGGAALSSLVPTTRGDPAGTLTYLGLAAGDVTRAGTQRIGGVPAIHYHSVLNLGPGFHVPVDAWLDRQGRVRKIVITQRLPAAAIPAAPASTASPAPAATAPAATRGAASPSATVHLTVAFSDFGVHVNVSPPPSAQTSPMKVR